ncbi:MAG TPA: type VI secretion protein IcmF/TssM N-terminal domain-containing protein [Syntrophorhabdales bacterium]|nr:type VI secretion protein IcmF/TssM N-terminal domain-containing protein [Syntrophorhabdales bacterium]
MKNIFVKLLKFLLIVFAVLLIILLVFGLVLRMDWPWWVGLFLLLILAALGVGFLFLRRILARRREQRFVQQVIEQDEARIKTFAGKEREEMKALQDRWREAVEALRHSHLRKQGNPLYVLPWYMVIGESGSGKTTAIGSAKLSSPFAEVRRASGISGTKNCDWWFFEQAVIIDTAGRYAIPVDEGRDKEEWQKFLTLLVKYRKKEPLHGLIVSIAADKLLGASPEVLEEDGRSIRRRIDELMRVLGVKFPVYLLVTKCDLVQGMTRFSEQLPDKSLDQPMGFINQALSKDVAAFLDNAMNTIGERLRTLRILLLHHPQSKSVDPALLLFPEEFAHLRKGLDSFIKAAFQQNPYQETPVLRGLFFSSGRQEGTPYSHFLEALGLIGEKEVLPGTSRGLFLHEFFANILPADRRLFAPTSRALEWRALTRNLGLTAWILLGVAICGLLSFSFVKNLRTIRVGTHELGQAPVLKGELLSDLTTMDHFGQTILKIEAQNQNWWIPRFGLYESVNVELALKNGYCNQFHKGFLGPFDKQMADVMPRLLTTTASDDVVAQYVAHLVRRINLLKARLEGQGIDKLKEKPQPSYVSLLGSDQAAAPEVRKKFGYLYLYYLVWRGDTGEINKEVVVLQGWIKDLLASRNMQWLVAWVNKEGGLTPVTLGEFWGGSLALPDEKMVAPAFTRKGKEMIDAFLKETERALPDPVMLSGQKSNFEKWYRDTSFDTWQTFGVFFPKGAARLKGSKEWLEMAPRMASDKGPYFAFFNKAAIELEPISGTDASPLWLQQVYQFQLAKAQSFGKADGAVAKAAEQGKKIMTAVEKQLGKDVGADALEAQIAAGKAYQELMAALGSIGPAATSRAQAYQMAVQTYTEESAAGKSPFYAGYAAANRLKTGLGRGKPAEDMIARMITGPLDFLWTCVRMETACYLQKQWEEKVLAEAQGTSGAQAAQIMLGPDGPVWKFVKGSGIAAPFIGWSVQRRYYSKEVLGGSIPFDPPFFAFLARGAKVTAAATAAAAAGPAATPKKENFNVMITGLPTDVNPEARIKPHATRLELQCTGGVQNLLNQNYPVNKTFVFSPDGCGDVLFQIEISDFVLTKKYTGPRAFPEFLQDFRGGRRTFSPGDFPLERVSLERLGIRYIRVNYQFSGEGAILGAAAAAAKTSAPGQTPRNIVQCWKD